MKIFCIGRNYVAHAKELGNEIPDEPVVFMKPKSACFSRTLLFIIRNLLMNCIMNANSFLRISKNGKYIQDKFASKYYDAVTTGIDFTARDIQNDLKAKGLPWEKAKAGITLQRSVNGSLLQRSRTKKILIFAYTKIKNLFSKVTATL
jgi:2-keto-4-pentenoate hydratase/2-oxohepta-3-ene-1,7-dioic acid hydratase in catechol pathway